MAETGAEWAVIPEPIEESDTDRAAERSVFAHSAPDHPAPSSGNDAAPTAGDRKPALADGDKSSAELNAEIDATRAHLDEVVEELESRVDEKVESVQATVDEAKRLIDLRRLFKEHPIAVVAVAAGAIGLGIVGYRAVRYSLPVRLFLALRFGRLRELSI